jgi:predicted transcriptional regulator
VLSQQERAASHEDIEDVLCSKTRMKILKILVSAQLTPSEIAKEVGACYAKVAKHLEVLEDEDLIQHVVFGKRIRYYKLNENSERAIAVRSLVESFK